LDIDQAAALARFLEALIDSAPNLLVVVAGIQASLLQWRSHKIIQDSAWDRLAQFEVSLQRVPAAEGIAIVGARLQRFFEPFADLEPLQSRLRADALFPLGKPWADEFLQNKIDVRPRDVLNWAREGWRREQQHLAHVDRSEWWLHRAGEKHADGAAPPTAVQIQQAIDQKIAQKIAEHEAQRQAEPDTLAPDADNLAGLVYALLNECLDEGLSYPVAAIERLASSPDRARNPYLLARIRGAGEEHETRVGLVFVSTASATSATAALRRLAREAQWPDRLLLITDARQPLPLAAKGREYLRRLEARGQDRFQRLELSFDQYAQLDALQASVGVARSGDLEIDLPGGQTRLVSEQEVIQSNVRCGRYQNAAILRELLGEATVSAPGS
ncbi:MAG TPA: hypothetical protein VGY58_01695, partial [Gemmataceae bacterium]|nr:hypothetical protein [Gemmataceae bacterium]